MRDPCTRYARTLVPMLVRMLVIAAALVPAATALAAESAAASAAAQVAHWQRHQSSIDYVSDTRVYSCGVLEAKVRRLLRQLGARADMQVRAGGCNTGTLSNSRTGTIELSFYSLAPASVPGATGAVAAHWQRMDISPSRSHFLDGGDCELIRSLQSILSRELSWQGLRYDSSCFPGDPTGNDFHIQGSLLLPSGRRDP